MRLYRLENPVQRYSWGSINGLRDCLGIPNEGGGPLAEVWFGAHPKAPSVALLEGGRRRLDTLVDEEEAAILGAEVLGRFGPGLPFLLKALSAASPLSIQAHPAKRKAERGFDRENLAGIPLDAPDRNYRDRNHKPEMVMALTSFTGLFGFRPIDEIVANIRLAAPDDAARIIGRLEKNPGRMELSVFFYSLLSGDAKAKAELLARSRLRIEERLLAGGLSPKEEEILGWTLRLGELFPGDIGAFAPLMLNLLTLEPGESLYVAPGELHAYLKGEALELMANSDNVIRGGLTSKHVDLPELISVLSFDSERPKPFKAEGLSSEEELFPLLAPDFRLSRIRTGDDRLRRRPRGPEIILCAEGRAVLEDAEGSFVLARGEAAFVRADASEYSISGEALLYLSFVPPPEIRD